MATPWKRPLEVSAKRAFDRRDARNLALFIAAFIGALTLAGTLVVGAGFALVAALDPEVDLTGLRTAAFSGGFAGLLSALLSLLLSEVEGPAIVPKRTSRVPVVLDRGFADLDARLERLRARHAESPDMVMTVGRSVLSTRTSVLETVTELERLERDDLLGNGDESRITGLALSELTRATSVLDEALTTLDQQAAAAEAARRKRNSEAGHADALAARLETSTLTGTSEYLQVRREVLKDLGAL